MTIIKIEAEWNNAHCSLENTDYILYGWAELPAEFEDAWAEYAPFVNITTNDMGVIVGMTSIEEILSEPETGAEPDDMARISTAIEEGMTND